MTDFLMLRFDLSLIDAVFLYGILWAVITGIVTGAVVSLIIGMHVTFSSRLELRKSRARWSTISEELGSMARGEVVR